MIIYLHGFISSPASNKARAMRDYLQARGLGARFVCPALPDTPEAAVQAIEAEVRRAKGKEITFVGSSLGGFYATWFAEKYDRRAALINPAIRPDLGLAAYLGPQRNLYTGEAFVLSEAHLAGWHRLVVDRVDPERYLLLLETGDEVLDWREAARKYEGARTIIRDGGDHTMQSFPEHLPRILAFAGVTLD